MYGPVVYVRDRQAYIWESVSDIEFVVRSIFAKTIEHQDQREYRLAILTAITLEYATLDLTTSSEMRETFDPLRSVPAIRVKVVIGLSSQAVCLHLESSDASQDGRHHRQVQVLATSPCLPNFRGASWSRVCVRTTSL